MLFRFLRAAQLILAFLIFAGASHAAKTLVVVNPWAADPVHMNAVPQIFGAYTNWVSSVTPTAQLRKTTGDWWSYTFNNNAPGDFRILSLPWEEYGSGGLRNSNSINLNTQFATSDTLWMITTSTPSVPPVILTRAPSKVVLMLQNPWEATQPGLAPSMQIESKPWQVLSSVAGPGGWYSTSADLFSHLQVGIRNAGATAFLGANGVSATAATMLLDSMLVKNDTVWIVPAAARTLILPNPPATRTGVVMLLNPWESIRPGQNPSMRVDVKSWRATSKVAGSPGWYSLALDSFSTIQLAIRNADSSSWLGSTGTSPVAVSMLLDTALAKNDTIWIVPTQGAPRILSAPPVATPVVVMLWNPWESTLAGKAPSIRIETQPWKPFAPVATSTGWYASAASFYGVLSVGIRNADSSAYLDASGITGTASTLTLDSAMAKNDTIWIVPTQGAPRILSSAPKTRTVMVFNPWDGSFPLERPVAFADGAATGIAMAASVKFCGWFALSYPATPTEIAFRSSQQGAWYGVSGYGYSSGIVVSLLTTDTVWIDTRQSFPRVGTSYPGGAGICPTQRLATTVYDFAKNHPDFGHANGGTIFGMVHDSLDADRKPIKRLDTAWNSQSRVWFRDSSAVNASACRDLELSLDTATGAYRRIDTAYFPIDDLRALPGGGPNPFNEMVATPALPHDHGFCTESHGEFQYALGQKLTFGGTDDRWFFLDGIKRVDLGGVHSDTTVSVLLDTMGLVPGGWYGWDLFACQRTDSASRLSISSNLKPTTVPRHLLTDSAASPGVRVARIQTATATGQGCQAVVRKTPAKGIATLRGPGLPSTPLSVGINFGSIDVSDSSWQVRIDTSRFKGLQPGRYFLKLASFGDSTVWREFEFQVPNRGYRIDPGARCDLMSSIIRDTAGCLDISRLDGVTLRVPAAVTRLATDGLVLCGNVTTSVPGTDVVYVVDQSGSMYYSDPTSARGQIVRDAITLQATMSPSSYAGWISFDDYFTPSPMYQLSDPVQRQTLLQDVRSINGGSTNYLGPIGWSRAMLQGATSAVSPAKPASPSSSKAIIMISDGEPWDDPVPALDPGAIVQDQFGYNWTLPNLASPPVYGFLLTSSGAGSGSALKDLTVRTNGAFIPIPVNDPDSLRKAMKRVLGAIISPAVPDTLFILNTRNGQRSVGLSGKQEGAGWRMKLDSLVGLEPGKNVLELHNVLKTNHGDSTVLARWTVVVSDSGLNLSGGGGDSTLDASCFEPTKLKVRPATDSSRHYADGRDTALRISLDARYDRQFSFPLTFSTLKSLDSGSKMMLLSDTPTTVRAKVEGTNPWTLPPVLTIDTLIQTRYGWDTVRVVFHTPRDWRDSAVAFLPVYHPWPVSVRLSPDTADGYSGTFRVAVSDSNILADTVRARIRHRLGDSLSVLLRRDSTGDFSSRIPYRQNKPVVAGDSLLQTGPVRLAPLDSVYATYLTARDTAILRRPPAMLRFIDAVGRPVDTLALRRLDLDEIDSVGVGTFVDTLLLPRTDSVDIFRPSWLDVRAGSNRSTQGIRLSAGTAKLAIQGNRPGLGGQVVFRITGNSDSISLGLDVLPYRLRFVDGAGNLADSAFVDRDLFSDTLMHVEIWGQRGRCTSCSGWILDSASAPQIALTDSAGIKADSFQVSEGCGALRLNGTATAADAKVSLRSPALWTDATIHPVNFRPYRMRFVDGPGNLVDSASLDRDLFYDTLLNIQIWGRDGLCTRCDGSFFASSAASQISFADSAAAKVDSFALVAGRGSVRINASAPATDSVIFLKTPVFEASASVAVTYRPYRMRFVDEAGNVVDSAFVDRDLFSDTLLNVQVWGRNGLCTRCDGSFFASSAASQISLADSAAAKVDSFALVAGRGSVRINGLAPTADQRIELRTPLFWASAAVAPVSFHAYRIRFLDATETASDSVWFDTLLRKTVPVQIEIWGMHGPVRASGHLRATSASNGLVVLDSAGAPDSLFALVEGKATIHVRSDIPVHQGLVTFSVDSLWAKSTGGPFNWRSPAPDSATYFDRDGDGGLDAVTAWFPIPWNPANQLRLPWPDSTHVLDLSLAQRNVSDDSLWVEWTFPAPQSPKTTIWNGTAPSARFSWDSNSPLLAFAALERIAPIPLRARLYRGASVDTLVTWVSEPLDSSRLGESAKLLGRTWPDSIDIPSGVPTWNGTDRTLRLAIGADSVDRFVRPADSVRLQADARDLGLSAPGERSRSVEVEGLGRAPLDAVVSDLDADGRADHVTLRFAQAPRSVDSYTFRWSDRDGRIQDRELSASKAVGDSSGRVLSFSVDPWAFGATSCPDSGCREFGELRTTRWGDTLARRFDLLDGVAPVILKAQLRFATPIGLQDTLRAILSESVRATEAGSWLRWGKPSLAPLGDSILRHDARQIGTTLLELLVDSTFEGTASDSLRLAFDGGVADSLGNLPGRLAHWAPLELGPIPLRIDAAAWPAIARYTQWAMPATEPPLTIFVRPTRNDSWKSLDGRAPSQETSHYAGLLLQTNEQMDGGALYLYDNLGVSVAHIDLAALLEAVRTNRVDRALRGGYEVWIAWNGKTQRGTLASSGVYPGRLVAWKRVGSELAMVQKVFKLGWKMPIAPDWDENDMPNW